MPHLPLRLGARLARILALIGGVWAAHPAPAIETEPLPRVHALTGARVVVAPGRVLDQATVVLRDGVIEACGPRVAVPSDARVWDLAGKTIYPGLLDPYAVVAAASEATGKAATPENATPGEHPALHPQRDCSDLPELAPRAEKLRRAGFTTVAWAPGEGLLRGSGCVANTGEGALAANLLRPRWAQVARLAPTGGEGRYPASLMGAVALFRQTLLDARWHRQAQEAFGRNPAQIRPPQSATLAALEAVARGEETLLVETEDILDSLRALALAREYSLRLFLVGNGEEYKRLVQLAAQPVPHLLPLAFPAAPKLKAGEELALGLDELRHWNAAPDNPRLLLAAGLTVAFTAHRLSEPAEIFARLARAMAQGLTADQALAGLTTAPAELLGLAGRAGSVEPGKMANLVIVDGDLFVDKPKLRAVWVDGKPYEIEERKSEEKPKGRATAGEEESGR